MSLLLAGREELGKLEPHAAGTTSTLGPFSRADANLWRSSGEKICRCFSTFR